MEKTQCEDLIRNCNFNILQQKCQMSKKVLREALKAIDRIGILESNILGYYACLCLLQLELTDKEKAEIHHTAAVVLTTGINYTDGAYMLGYYHAQKCMELEPGNTNYRQSFLLTFKDIPDLGGT